MDALRKIVCSEAVLRNVEDRETREVHFSIRLLMMMTCVRVQAVFRCVIILLVPIW